MTVINNNDMLVFGDLIIPGLKLYDALSAAAYKAIALLPFLLGYHFLRTSSSQHELLRSISIMVSFRIRLGNRSVVTDFARSCFLDTA